MYGRGQCDMFSALYDFYFSLDQESQYQVLCCILHSIIILIIFWVGGLLFDFYHKNKYIFCRKKGLCKNWMCKHALDCYLSRYCKVGDGEYYLPEMEREYKKKQRQERKEL